MRVKNLNKSSASTKARIKQAFVKLMHEKKRIREISVSELVKSIDINRSTFYTHYADLSSVAADIENDISSETLDAELETKEDVLRYIETTCSNFYRNRETYFLLLSSHETMPYLAKLRRKVYEKLLKVYRLYSKDSLIGFKVELFTDGMAEQLIRYFRKKSTYGFEELKQNFVICASQLFEQ